MNTERQRSEYQASEQLTGTYAEREALRRKFKAIAPAPKRKPKSPAPQGFIARLFSRF